MILPPQRLIEHIPEDNCKYCEGRGFYIIPHSSPEGYIEPNEVIECEKCNGTGKNQTTQGK